jgi:hypothetical protein
MDYSIVQLLRDKLAETHYLRFTESDQNSNTGGFLIIIRKDSYSIEEQTDHQDKWIGANGKKCSKLVGSLITIKSIRKVKSKTYSNKGKYRNYGNPTFIHFSFFSKIIYLFNTYKCTFLF